MLCALSAKKKFRTMAALLNYPRENWVKQTIPSSRTQLKMFSHHPASSEPGHLPCTPAAGENKIVHEVGEPTFLARPCESPPPPAHLNTTFSSGAQKTSSELSY